MNISPYRIFAVRLYCPTEFSLYRKLVIRIPRRTDFFAGNSPWRGLVIAIIVKTTFLFICDTFSPTYI